MYRNSLTPLNIAFTAPISSNFLSSSMHISFVLNSPKVDRRKGKNVYKLIYSLNSSIMIIADFHKLMHAQQLFLKNFYTKFHENLTHGCWYWVRDKCGGSPHMAFFFCI
jgi:hypothetical protein